MALPGVNINFSNGAIKEITPSADCVAGLVATATAVTGTGGSTFALGTGYVIYKRSSLASLGITHTNNPFLYKQVNDFYDNAGEGAELWIMGVAATVKPSEMADQTNAYARKLIQVSNGRIRAIGIAHKPADSYEATITNGLDSDVLIAAQKMQQLAEWATVNLYAPVVGFIAGRGYAKENKTDLPDLTTYSYNRVGILIGDTEIESEGAAIGLLLGKFAACSVEKNIARVKDGALNVSKIYIDDEDPSEADVETLFNKGYITFRTHTGKSGYFFIDDTLATGTNDDYRHLTRRRTADKAYRIIHKTMLEYVQDNIPVTDAGFIQPAYAKSIESEVIASIANEMTANGELGSDPDDSSDKGVTCYVNPQQNIISTSRIDITAKVKPYGYAGYINVELGFLVEEE